MTFKTFLADQTAEMVGFTIIRYLEFSAVLVKNCTTNGISK